MLNKGCVSIFSGWQVAGLVPTFLFGLHQLQGQLLTAEASSGGFQLQQAVLATLDFGNCPSTEC